jgi:uncharacterized DUF497 family protein
VHDIAMKTPTARFAFDPKKAAANLKKHGVSFTEAMTVFNDSLAATGPDELHSEDEERLITVGESARQRILFVVHTYHEYTIRLISARPATASEKKEYEES